MFSSLGMSLSIVMGSSKPEKQLTVQAFLDGFSVLGH